MRKGVEEVENQEERLEKCEAMIFIPFSVVMMFFPAKIYCRRHRERDLGKSDTASESG